MFIFAAFIVIITSLNTAFSTSLCSEKEWFNDLSGKCQACKACPEKSWEVAPCIDFQDTMCVNLIEIGRSIELSIKNPQDSKHGMSGWHRWHEMEGKDNSAKSEVFTKEKILSKSKFDDMDNMWSQVIIVVLCLAFICVSTFSIMMALKCSRKYGNRSENSKTVARARLFSRDRLNTTEYMNNLATLDRRLAIDEILEKRKRAIFEPQLLNENLYTDEVFVDISGLPRNLQNSHDYEELDHRKCLLQMQERQ